MKAARRLQWYQARQLGRVDAVVANPPFGTQIDLGSELEMVRGPGNASVPTGRPRLARRAEVAAYLGISVSLFDRSLRPWLREVRLGERNRYFDLADVDQAIDRLKRETGLADDEALTALAVILGADN